MTRLSFTGCNMRPEWHVLQREHRCKSLHGYSENRRVPCNVLQRGCLFLFLLCNRKKFRHAFRSLDATWDRSGMCYNVNIDEHTLLSPYNTINIKSPLTVLHCLLGLFIFFFVKNVGLIDYIFLVFFFDDTSFVHWMQHETGVACATTWT